MSVSLREVLEDVGYDLDTKEGCIWLLATQNEYAELVEKAEEIVEAQESDDEFDPQPEGDFSGASYDPDFGGR